MIRSLGLHGEHETKKYKQIPQHLNLQELSSGCPLSECQNPVFQAPVTPTNTDIVWEKCKNIMVQVATEMMVPHEVDMITVHNIEMKCAHYSYVTIAGHPVKIKQDTAAEVNVMSKHVFDKLSSGTKSNALLNKARMTNITGYGQNPIDYIGTCMFKVRHNDVQRDVLLFITNVDDTKVIFGSKAYQEFRLVEILCDDQCHCKKVEFEVATVNDEFPIRLSVPDKMAIPKLSLVDIHTKIDGEDPKGHILHLFPDLFEGIGTMENIKVHLDVDPKD